MFFLSVFWRYEMEGFHLLFYENFFHYLHVCVLFVHLQQLFPSAEVSSESDFC